MVKKVKFKVLWVSGEDEKYKASELNNHGPSIRGWLSSQNCIYPQEIIFELNSETILHQIQILAHHYIIPERIDVWIAQKNGDNDERIDVDSIFFEYIGFIILNNNENTKFKCRELKTIEIPPSGPINYVKLTLHQNHPNNLNVFNQVGIVAVQIIGDDASNKVRSSSNGEIKMTETSIFDDLAFEMYVDNEIAELLKQLEEKKKQAVSDERFEYAQKLKHTIRQLHLSGEKLGKMEVAKKQAIQQEDYTRAKKKKKQIDDFKAQIFNNLNVEELLEKNGVLSKNDDELEPDNENVLNILPAIESETSTLHKFVVDLDLNKSVSKQPTEPQMPLSCLSIEQEHVPAIYESPVSPLHFGDFIDGNDDSQNTGKQTAPASKTNSLRRRNKSATINSHASEENIITPFRSYFVCEPKDTAANVSVLQLLTRLNLTEKEKKQAMLSINCFGKSLVEKILSKQFTDKEEGLRMLTTALKLHIQKQEVTTTDNKVTHSPNKLARATTSLLHRCLRDKVYSVYSLATEVIRFFFAEFITGRVSSSEVTKSVSHILPDLLSKSGDNTPRIRNLAIHTILSLADSPEVKNLNIIPSQLTKILTTNVHVRLALSRLEMVEQLVLSQGISTDKNSGMTCRILTEFGLSGLNHPAEAVRKMAEKILVLVYKENPRFVRRQLPPDDDITRRNILYRHLLQEFDRVDNERKLSTSESKLETTEKEFIPKYFDCLGKTLNIVNTEQKQSRCSFCQLESGLSTEKEINIHYWKYCPMLMRCIHCNQVIEIPSLQEHLTDDCEMKALYRKCQVCFQAVSADQLATHHASVQCTLMTMKKVCPLCFAEVKEDGSDWRTHLTSMCPKNPRTKYLSCMNEEFKNEK